MKKTIKLFNLQGKLINSVRIKTGKKPMGIAVTKNTNLVYTDHKDKSIVLPRDSESDCGIGNLAGFVVRPLGTY